PPAGRRRWIARLDHHCSTGPSGDGAKRGAADAEVLAHRLGAGSRSLDGAARTGVYGALAAQPDRRLLVISKRRRVRLAERELSTFVPAFAGMHGVAIQPNPIAGQTLDPFAVRFKEFTVRRGQSPARA